MPRHLPDAPLLNQCPSTYPAPHHLPSVPPTTQCSSTYSVLLHLPGAPPPTQCAQVFLPQFRSLSLCLMRPPSFCSGLRVPTHVAMWVLFYQNHRWPHLLWVPGGNRRNGTAGSKRSLNTYARGTVTPRARGRPCPWGAKRGNEADFPETRKGDEFIPAPLSSN